MLAKDRTKVLDHVLAVFPPNLVNVPLIALQILNHAIDKLLSTWFNRGNHPTSSYKHEQKATLYNVLSSNMTFSYKQEAGTKNKMIE